MAGLRTTPQTGGSVSLSAFVHLWILLWTRHIWPRRWAGSPAFVRQTELRRPWHWPRSGGTVIPGTKDTSVSSCFSLFPPQITTVLSHYCCLVIKCSHFASVAHRTASKAGVVPAQHRVASYSAQKTISPSLKHKNRPKMAGFSKNQRPMVLRLLTLQRSVHAADLIEASVPFAADDLWGDEGIFLKKKSQRDW